MQCQLKIIILIIFCSFSNFIAANEALFSEANISFLEGDTTIMQEQGIQILTDCAGVILDPGGYGDYQNGINSTITIQAPTEANVSLYFPLFHIENTFDDFFIYDGANTSAPLIGLYDNMDLQDQTIMSSGSAITIVFDTDNSVVREGFIIDYLIAGGGDTPLANFEVAQSSPIPLNFPLQFTDLSENAGTWLYDFGDGNQSMEQNPIHNFTEPGTYEVSLSISNCASTDTYTQTVIVQEAGQLTINPDEICVTLNSSETSTQQITLSNTGLGDLYYNFTEINNENPNALTVILGTGVIPPGGTQVVNLFFSSNNLLGGTYNHDLLLQTGDPNQIELIYPVKMIVIGTPLISLAPEFIAFPNGLLGNPQVDSICVANIGTDSLHVTDINIDVQGFSIEPTSFSLAPDEDIKIPITLLAEEVGLFSGLVSFVSNTAPTVVTVAILGNVIDPPVGAFNPDEICLNLGTDESTLFIMGASNQGGENFDWGFTSINTIPEWLEFGALSGSVATGEQQSVPIIINSEGLSAGVYEYNAAIFTNDPLLVTTSLYIKLNVVAPPTALFFTNDQNSCDGTVSFIDLSQGVVTSWLWDFGDNTSSDEQNPSHTYEENGVYDVSLITCNPAGCDTLLIEDFINFNEDQEICEAFTLGLTGDTTLYNCSGYIYDSGGPDGDYLSNSNYTVTLSPPDATSIYLAFDEFDLEDNWDFLYLYAGEDTEAPLLGTYTGLQAPGGGNLLVAWNSVTLQFVSDGFIDRPGFALSYSCFGPQTEASFLAELSEICSNEVSFFNNSVNGESYSWDFGDGNSSDEFSPTHIYNAPGTYTVSLTSENSFGTNTFTETVQIIDLPFELSINLPNNIYINNPVEFSYNSSLSLAQVEWSTSAGTTSNLDEFSNVFTQLGEAEISLIATDMNGCQVSSSEQIFVDELSNIKDNENISSFKVYPVPTGEIINIELDLKAKYKLNLVVFNSMGQQVLRENYPSSSSLKESLNLSEFASGIYYLSLWINEEFAGRRRIVLIE